MVEHELDFYVDETEVSAFIMHKLPIRRAVDIEYRGSEIIVTRHGDNYYLAEVFEKHKDAAHLVLRWVFQGIWER